MDDALDQGWEDHLQQGEKIIWQGRPDQSLRLSLDFPMLFSVSSALSFCLIMFGLAEGVAALGAVNFALILLVLLSLTALCLVNDTIRRRGTWYTLSNKRAFIATSFPVLGKALKSYRIDADTVLDYRPKQPASIYFAQEWKNIGNTSEKTPVGFRRIHDGQKVYRLMQEIQLNEATV